MAVTPKHCFIEKEEAGLVAFDRDVVCDARAD